MTSPQGFKQQLLVAKLFLGACEDLLLRQRSRATRGPPLRHGIGRPRTEAQLHSRNDKSLLRGCNPPLPYGGREGLLPPTTKPLSQSTEEGLLCAEVCGGAPSIGRAADDMPALSHGIEIVFSTGTVIEAASNKRLKSIDGPSEDMTT